jgi:hypothetical protein
MSFGHSEHPIILEFRDLIHKKCPDFLDKAIYFRWDEGSRAEKLFLISHRFCEIENQMNKTTWEDKKTQQNLKQQLMDQLPLLIKLYQDLSGTVSEQEWKEYEKSKSSSFKGAK